MFPPMGTSAKLFIMLQIVSDRYIIISSAMYLNVASNIVILIIKLNFMKILPFCLKVWLNVKAFMYPGCYSGNGISIVTFRYF